MAPVYPTDVYAVSPEKTSNFEIGVKGDLFDHKLSIDGDVYYVRINDQQLESVVFAANGLAHADHERLEQSRERR